MAGGWDTRSSLLHPGFSPMPTTNLIPSWVLQFWSFFGTTYTKKKWKRCSKPFRNHPRNWINIDRLYLLSTHVASDYVVNTSPYMHQKLVSFKHVNSTEYALYDEWIHVIKHGLCQHRLTNFCWRDDHSRDMKNHRK